LRYIIGYKKFTDDETKIHISSLRLDSAALIWWESKTQEDMRKHGKILTSWNDFYCCNLKDIFTHCHISKRLLWIGKILDKLKDIMCKALLKNLGEEIWFWE
jgi:hypothetical protein